MSAQRSTAKIIDLEPFANPEMLARKYAHKALPAQRTHVGEQQDPAAVSAPEIAQQISGPEKGSAADLFADFARRQGMAWGLLATSAAELVRGLWKLAVPPKMVEMPYWMVLSGVCGWAGSVSFLSTMWLISL